MRVLAYFMLGLGVVLLSIGAFGQFQRSDSAFLKLTATTGAGGALLWLKARLQHWRQRRNLYRHRTPTTELALTLIPQLRGEYTPYVIEAAVRLGEAGDMTAVPALMETLDRWIESQRPGWRDVAASIADALALIGDVRSLPLLKRLENVRGIGLIPNIRHAIAVIEPQANLLRPSQSEDSLPTNLLRPSKEAYDQPETMLRPLEEAVWEEAQPSLEVLQNRE
jgi:hypothetical protein